MRIRGNIKTVLKSFKFAGLGGLILALSACQGPTPAPEALLAIHFIDAGQGDCIFLEFPEGKNLLIDAGPDTAAVELLRILDSLGVDTIDNVLLTHPHTDHYNGLKKTIQTHPVRRWLENNLLSYQPEPGYAALQQAVDSLGIVRDTIRQGAAIAGYANTAIEVLWPLSEPFIGGDDNINGNSIVIRITYKNITMLFPGDLNQDAEKAMLDSNWLAPVDLLKAGHHGSLTSNIFPFLQALKPRLTVVTVQAGNEFNLPSDDTMQRFAMLGLTVYRMDETGSLHFITAGKSISLKE